MCLLAGATLLCIEASLLDDASLLEQDLNGPNRTEGHALSCAFWFSQTKVKLTFGLVPPLANPRRLTSSFLRKSHSVSHGLANWVMDELRRLHEV